MKTDEVLPEATAFPVPDRAAWRALAEATLKGAEFDKRLVARTPEGITLPPLYTRADAADAAAGVGAVGGAPFTRGAARTADAPWIVAQILDVADPAEANAQALTDLTNGASGLVLAFGHRPDRPGLAARTVADVDRVFVGVFPELISIALDGGADGVAHAALVMAWAAKRGIPLGSLALDLGVDPVGAGLREGRVPDGPSLGAVLADILGAARRRGHAGPVLRVDARPWHEAGASTAQELGHALATALEYLRALEGAGVPPDVAADAIGFQLALDADEFTGIATPRALRALWASLTAEIGLAPRRAVIAVESSRRMASARDPWTNLLRVTSAAVAGALGGADRIALHPFTAALGVPDGFARRLARNTQAILIGESGLGRVADPAGGSFYIEKLTSDLIGAAWEVFRGTEAAGGLLAALAGGAPQRAVAAVAEARRADIAKRKRTLVGVSDFPDIGEAPVATAAAAPPPAPPRAAPGASFEAAIVALAGGATLDGVSFPAIATRAVAPLPETRLAAAFEALRDAADAATTRPVIALACLGTAADATARATYAKNLFEAGGIATVMLGPEADAAALAAAVSASGANGACLCSSDAVYAERGVPALSALRAAAAGPLVLAGHPGEARAAYAAAGATHFVHVGIDAVAALGDLQRALGLGAAP
jgi:methylmalonyl-CoA mutase